MKSLVPLIVCAIARAGVAQPLPPPFDEPLDVVSFELDSASIDPIGRAQLREPARWIAAHPDRRLVIEAHTDAIGGAAYNIRLAARRARAVRDTLVALGAPRDRLILSIFGKAKPPSRTPTAAANRVAIIYAMTPAPDEVAYRTSPNDVLVSLDDLRQRASARRL
jgi:outer membrane protein OmpA-like peptidoglycan-associated protein